MAFSQHQLISVTPDMILCRSESPIEQSVRDKIALFCNVPSSHVIEGRDVSSIYEVPLAIYKQNAGRLIKDRLKIKKTPQLGTLKKFIKNYKNPKHQVTIAMCGKYTELIDSYKSVMEAFVHAGVENNARVNIKWIQTEKIKNSKNVENVFSNVNGVLILPRQNKYSIYIRENIFHIFRILNFFCLNPFNIYSCIILYSCMDKCFHYTFI